MPKKTNLQKAFELFYDKKHKWEYLRSPFLIDGYTYAADGQAAIRCPNEKINFDFEREREDEMILETLAEKFQKQNMCEHLPVETFDWGALIEEKTKKLKKPFYKHQAIKYKGLFFCANNFFLLKKAQALLGCDVLLLDLPEKIGERLLFKAGFAEIAIMPITIETSVDVILII
jgi:hypothetical protein